MKKSSNLLLLASVLVSSAVFVGCGPKKTPEQKEQEKQAKLLTAAASGWSVPSEGGSVTRGNETESIGDWSDFALTLTGDQDGGKFTAKGVPEGYDKVWKSSGTWKFKEKSNGKTIIRGGDEVEMTISEVTDSKLVLTFTIAEETPAASRVEVVAGKWGFSLAPVKK